MKILKSIRPLIILVLLCSCKEKQNEKTANLTGSITDKNVAIQVTMEGKTHSILQKNILTKAVNFEYDTLQFLFQAEDNPFQLNLNLANTDIINKGNATYLLPEADSGNVIIDLNFFNGKREGRKIDRRIVFRKGTINIATLTKNKLQISFEGEGRPMMDFKNSFPISIYGKVNVSY